MIGSGFFGAVLAERIANDLDAPVLVIEKRQHTGGNSHSLNHPGTGIHYHLYGTHIFHTRDREVWRYINRFTEFNGYRHQVLTTYQNRVYQMPINLETINSFYDMNLKPYEVQDFIKDEVSKSGQIEKDNFEGKAISMMGKPLYEAFIKGYTSKQWGCEPGQLPATILKRLPFRTNYDENYFFDPWQGIPLEGYAAIFDKLLTHPKIRVELNTDFFDIKHLLGADAKIIYTGPIDKLFDYKLGKLEWRRLVFEEQLKNVADYQGTSVMNYSDIQIPYTRIHEPRHLHPEKSYSQDQTLTIKEFSRKDDGSDPYYPIGGAKNRNLYNEYHKELLKQKKILVGGRLGDYKYYDMDQTIAAALQLYNQLASTVHA